MNYFAQQVFDPEGSDRMADEILNECYKQLFLYSLRSGNVIWLIFI